MALCKNQGVWMGDRRALLALVTPLGRLLWLFSALQRRCLAFSLDFTGVFLFHFNILGLKLTFSSNLSSSSRAREKERRCAFPFVVAGLFGKRPWDLEKFRARLWKVGGNSTADLRALVVLCSCCLWHVSGH